MGDEKKPESKAFEEFDLAFKKDADEFAHLITDQFVKSFLAGEEPSLEDYLAICPTEEIRAKVKLLCRFEQLVQQALEDPGIDVHEAMQGTLN